MVGKEKATDIFLLKKCETETFPIGKVFLLVLI